MSPERFIEALHTIRWTTQTLADAIRCDLSYAEAMADGHIEVPAKLAAWLEALAQCHEAAETGRPTSLRGKRHTPDAPH